VDIGALFPGSDFLFNLEYYTANIQACQESRFHVPG
jgi:hypothetical protein